MRPTPFLVVVWLQAALIEFVTALELLCDNDTDCEDGFTCQENICRNCVHCSMLFRKENICVTDFKDCGDCLEGYKEILLTHFSAVAKFCVPAKKEARLKNCTSDYDCPSNGYCNEGLCVECFDCNLINRLQSVGNCTKGKDKCGPCFIGFLEVYAEDQSNFTCEENVCALCHTYRQFAKDLSFNFTFLCVTAIIIFIALMKSCFYRSYETGQDLQQADVLQQFSTHYYLSQNHSQKEADCKMTVTDSSLRSGDNEKVSPNPNVPPISLTESCEDASGRQLVDMIASSNESSGHKPALDTQDSAHVTQGTRISAKEVTNDLPRDQNQEGG